MRKHKTVRYTTYKKQFENMVKDGVLVKGYKYDEYVEETINLEDYKQCYKPGFTPREEMPRYWFVSKEGFLVNARGHNLTFVKPNLESDRPQFTINCKPKNKHISSYGLVGLVWGSYIEPDAYTYMQMNGIDCIGSNPKADENGKIKGRVQPHHTSKEGYIKEKTIENYILNNRPEYIEFLTNKDHTIIGGLAGDTTKDIDKMVETEYKYDDVPHEHIKVYAYKEMDIKTGQETKIAKVLTTEEINNIKFIPISAYIINEKTRKKINRIDVKLKRESDIEAYKELSQEEQEGIKAFIKDFFKSNKDITELEFRYKEISIISTRIL